MNRDAIRRCLPAAAAVLLVLAAAGCGWVEWPAGPGGWEASRGVPASRSQPQGARGGAPAPAERPGRITVAPGDSVHRLAGRYGVPARSIIEANNLKPPYRLYVGQSLALPRDREHVVRSGETLSGLAVDYGVDMMVLASANGLMKPYHLRRGQRLRIPEAPTGMDAADVARAGVGSDANEPPSPPAALRDPPQRPESLDADPVEPAATVAAATPRPPVEIGKPPRKTGGGFLWPVRGRVISTFGSKGSGLRNDGINIAAAPGTPVRAAENGVVAYAGNELKAFGNLVLIKHDGGWVTTYAHNGALSVKRGDVVYKGQVIAEVGSSGSVSESQLHFEMRKGRKAVDPLRHLPPASA